MKNRQYSQFALLAMANRKHNEHRHIRSAIRELLAAELDLMNDGNEAGVGHLTVLDRVREALAELRGIDEQIQTNPAALVRPRYPGTGSWEAKDEVLGESSAIRK